MLRMSWLTSQQIEDLRLDGDVERGGRLVGDQQFRLAGERDGNGNALAHAARTTGADNGADALPAGIPTTRQSSTDRASAARPRRPRWRVSPRRSGPRSAWTWIERRDSILKNHARCPCRGRRASPVPDSFSRSRPSKGCGRSWRTSYRCQNADDGPRQHALAGTWTRRRCRVAWPPLNPERYAVDRLHHAAARNTWRDRSPRGGAYSLSPSALPRKPARTRSKLADLVDRQHREEHQRRRDEAPCRATSPDRPGRPQSWCPTSAAAAARSKPEKRQARPR